MPMTLEEMQLAVARKLPTTLEMCSQYDELTEETYWYVIWTSNLSPDLVDELIGRDVNWSSEGLQICHEAEKLIIEGERINYITKLYDLTDAYTPQNTTDAHKLMVAASATYQQRLEALCRIWFPENFS